MNNLSAKTIYDVIEDAITIGRYDLRILGFDNNTKSLSVVGPYSDMLLLRKELGRHGVTVNGK